jgi:hypothetical protein
MTDCYKITAIVKQPPRVVIATPITRAAPLIPSTGVVAGTYSNATFEVGADGRLISVVGSESGSTKEFVFVDQQEIIAEHNFGRRAITTILNEQGNRIYCAESHTLNSVTLNFNFAQSGVIICG